MGLASFNRLRRQQQADANNGRKADEGKEAIKPPEPKLVPNKALKKGGA